MKRTLFAKRLATEPATVHSLVPPSVGPQKGTITVQGLCNSSSQEAKAYLSYQYAKQYKVLPLGVLELGGRKILTLASTRIDDAETVSELRFITGLEIKLLEVPSEVLERAIFNAYRGADSKLAEAVGALSVVRSGTALRADEKGIRYHGKVKGAVPEFLELLIDNAIARGASDVHLVPKRDGTVVSMRVHGDLLTHDRPVCDLRTHQVLVNRIKVLADLDISKKSALHDGQLTVPVHDVMLSIRVSIVPTLHGEKVVLRVHDRVGARPLEALGFDRASLALVQESLSSRSGLVLFVGPTGSGKTTSLYGGLEFLVRRNLSLVSVEDPIEKDIEGVAQTAVDEGRGLSYVKCLRSMLRQDPDAIMVGEIRDSDSAQLAFQAALTGHLLLSSMHGGSIDDALLRLEFFGVSSLTMSQALRLVVVQQLVPLLCERCRVVDLNGSNKFKFQIYRGVGCPHCDYAGVSDRSMIAHPWLMTYDLGRLLQQEGLRAMLAACAERCEGSPASGNLQALLREGKISLETFQSYSL